jgi:hypothetical protein
MLVGPTSIPLGMEKIQRNVEIDSSLWALVGNTLSLLHRLEPESPGERQE